ncbi:HDOD domain-containing protein [Rummeliibacillus sp. TYF005]|uniref:EAL and HDOD domain-containing protein n=1 Tax=unclassified Rummeliibacillus TaxID=2622809 RepID=UPI000E670EDC|nr:MULTISPECIES: HDOD domain-containing protein [unclassified Rummeliibacillus]RIJ67939.1 HDOD domain-containing protein [Rummeliibacillus sp. POC4]RPJ95790.1 HDOD domain-containing protein [Rummeliibacillus sp. TYF005]
MEIFIGRQPIFNTNEQVYSYELLYRNGIENNAFPDIDSDIATVELIINSFLSIGFEELSNGKPCFINFTENLLMNDIMEQLNPSQVVIEILEDVPITKGLIKRVKELKAKGYRIALDDFIMQEDSSIYNDLFPYIDIIKVDFIISSVDEREKIENRIKKLFPHIILLAEKVETMEQYIDAIQRGYKLFQGYFFTKPQIIRANDIPANLLQYYRVIALLRVEEPDIDEITEGIEHDIALSYKLMKLINSSSKRSKFKIRSIKQAILHLGLEDLKRWIYILTYRESQKYNPSGAYDELMKTSLCRAKMCELLAKYNNKRNTSEYFLIGMFSLIDALLRRPIKSILMQLPLSDEIVETISGSDTSMQPYLQLTVAVEQMDFEVVNKIANDLNINIEEVFESFKAANKWTNRIS